MSGAPAEGAQGLRRPARCRSGDRPRRPGPGRVAAEARRHRPRRHAAQRRTARSARAPARRSTACWDAGIPVVGVTGRGPRLLDSVRDALAGRGIAVLAQGGYVVDLERDEVLRTVGLPRDRRQAVIERIESVAGDLIVAVEDAAEQAEAFTARCACSTASTGPTPSRRTCCRATRCCRPAPSSRSFLRSSTLGQDELLALARSRRRPGRRRGHPRRARLHRGAAARASPRPPVSPSPWSATASASATSSCSGTCPTTCR